MDMKGVWSWMINKMLRDDEIADNRTFTQNEIADSRTLKVNEVFDKESTG